MVSITELAAQKIKEVLKAQNKEDLSLRLYLAGVGSGGPNFGMALDDSKTDEDVLDEEYGVSILTEKRLSNYLEGATIDFTESGGFEIRPAKNCNSGGCESGCCGGCGSTCQ